MLKNPAYLPKSFDMMIHKVSSTSAILEQEQPDVFKVLWWKTSRLPCHNIHPSPPSWDIEHLTRVHRSSLPRFASGFPKQENSLSHGRSLQSLTLDMLCDFLCDSKSTFCSEYNERCRTHIILSGSTTMQWNRRGIKTAIETTLQ